MMAKIEVAGLVEGDEVDMHMRHIDAHHGLTYLDAGAHFLQPLGNALGEEMELAEEVVVEVEDVVHLLLGDAEDMAFDYGVDVEEGQAVVGFGYFVAGYLAGYDT